MTGVLPKVLLHDHLDGGVRPETMIDLAAEIGYTDLPAADPEALARTMYQGDARSLEDYLGAFRHTFGVMQTPEAMHRVAYEAIEDLAGEGVVYAELRFAPSLHLERGMTRRDAIAGVVSGLGAAESDFGVPGRVIVDILRQQSDGIEVAEAAAAFAGQGVVAIDLAGPEAGFPPSLHHDALGLARDAGLRVTIHAGEGDGLESIAGAIAEGAERIGHGARIVEDCRVEDGEIVEVGPLAAEVRDRRIPLELCPTSNIHTRMWPTHRDHPIGALFRAGFAVTVNTDNRLMSGITMTHEFEVLTGKQGFGVEDLHRVTATAAAAAFCDDETRRRVESRVAEGYAGS